MEQETQPLSQRYMQEARDTFCQRCYSNPPALRDLFEEVVQIAKTVSETLPVEQILLLLQEHPEWIQAQAHSPGREPIAVIVSQQLAYLIRHDLDDHWATILLKQ